jgi:hypothetical protein
VGSASGGVIGAVFIFIIAAVERLDSFLAIAGEQHFDLLLRGAQRRLALAGERHAALESLESFFERDVALFEFRDECFEFRQRFFEVGKFWFGFHAREVNTAPIDARKARAVESAALRTSLNESHSY